MPEFYEKHARQESFRNSFFFLTFSVSHAMKNYDENLFCMFIRKFLRKLWNGIFWRIFLIRFFSRWSDLNSFHDVFFCISFLFNLCYCKQKYQGLLINLTRAVQKFVLKYLHEHIHAFTHANKQLKTVFTRILHSLKWSLSAWVSRLLFLGPEKSKRKENIAISFDFWKLFQQLISREFIVIHDWQTKKVYCSKKDGEFLFIFGIF